MNDFFETALFCKGIVFVFLLIGFCLFFQRVRWLEFIVNVLKKTKADMEESSKKRLLENRRNLRDITQKYSWWNKLEKILEYSGLKRKIPSLDAEKFLAFQIVTSALLFLAGMIVAGGKGAVLLTVLSWIVEVAYLQYGRTKALKSVNDNLLKFLDFLGNYSITSGEVTAIFHQISKYMEEPLKGALEECCYEAQTTGDTELALLSMAEKIEHPKFKELARNMEINLRYCADFTVLVSNSRKSVRDYLKKKEERKGILREGAINLLLLLGMSLVVLITVDGLVEASVWQILFFSIPGNLSLLVVMIIVMLFVGQMMGIEK